VRLLKRAHKAGVTVDPAVGERLEAYFQVLARWNRKINLTAFSLMDPSDQTLDRLLVEPLAAARFVPASPLDWFDLGSGGGSPAIPLKAVRPSARLVLVESKARKAAFLREAVRILEFSDAVVEHARFEEVVKPREGPGDVQLVTVRGIRVDGKLLEVASRLLEPGGRLLLFGSDPARMPAQALFRVEATATLTESPSSRLLALRHASAAGQSEAIRQPS